MILHRKLRREFWASRGMMFAITALMSVGVMGFIYMKSAYRTCSMPSRNTTPARGCRTFGLISKKSRLPISTLSAKSRDQRNPRADWVLRDR